MKNEKVKIKEELYIKWEIPTLNEQLRHLELSNFFSILFCFSFTVFHFFILFQLLLGRAQSFVPNVF